MRMRMRVCCRMSYATCGEYTYDEYEYEYARRETLSTLEQSIAEAEASHKASTSTPVHRY